MRFVFFVALFGKSYCHVIIHKALPEVGELNGDVHGDDGTKVIEFKAHKTKEPNPSDRVLGASCFSSASQQNGGIRKLQVAEFGSGGGNRTPDTASMNRML